MEPSSRAQKWLAEALGTGFLVFIGAGSIPATLILGNASDVAFSMADLGMISFAFMLVIVGMVYALGHISGCHINPAVTVALAATGKFPWRDVPGYVIAQVVGAIAGALAIVGTLGRTAADLGLGMTTYGDTTPLARATFAEFIGTALLAFVIFGVIDGRAAPGWAGLAIGSIVFAIIIVVGPATGASLNPARYLGPMFVGEVFACPCSGRSFRRTSSASSSARWPGRRLPHPRQERPATPSRHSRPASPRRSRHEEAHQRARGRGDRSPRGVSRPRTRPSTVDVENKVIMRAGGPTAGKVGLVSGGGSGHEPLHGGFVGYGMLDAACPGEVFTSPVPDQMLPATKAVDGGAGVLHIVKNYTGDVLNFQMAAELAADEDIEVT